MNTDVGRHAACSYDSVARAASRGDDRGGVRAPVHDKVSVTVNLTATKRKLTGELWDNESWQPSNYPASRFIVRADDPLLERLPFYRAKNGTRPDELLAPMASNGGFTNIVRALGGWGTTSWRGTKNGAAWQPEQTLPCPAYYLAFRANASDRKPPLKCRWAMLHERICSVVASGSNVELGLGNVPYAFSNASSQAACGQCQPPDDIEGECSAFVRALLTELVREYGRDKVLRWRFRIGTEENAWNGTIGIAHLCWHSVKNFLKWNDFTAQAILVALPGATVGPGNFGAMGTPALSEYGGGTSETATYGEAQRRLAAAGLLRYPLASDATVSALNDTCVGGSDCAYQDKGSQRMASNAGNEKMQAMIPSLIEFERDNSLNESAFSGEQHCDAGSAECVLTLRVATPAVRFLLIRTKTDDFELVWTQHVVPAQNNETRGFHAAIASGPVGWAVGIRGELVGLRFQANGSAAVAMNQQRPDMLSAARSLVWIRGTAPPKFLLGAGGSHGLSLYESYADVQKMQARQLASIPFGPEPSSVHNRGINGLVLLRDNKTVIGAHMSGLLCVAHLVPGVGSSRLRLKSLGTLATGSSPDAYDIAVFETGSATSIVIVGPASEHVITKYLISAADGSILKPAQWKVTATLAPPTDWPASSGCNRIRVSGSIAFISCFAAQLNSVYAVNLSSMKIVSTHKFVDEQPTGMIIVGKALLVAGGRGLMAFNISTPAAPALVASCNGGDGSKTCGRIARSGSQNFHSMGHRSDATTGDHFIVMTAQIDNNLGVLKVRNAALIKLLETSQ